MIHPRHLHPSDLQGLTRLCVRGVSGTTELVEHLHANISPVPSRRGANAEPRTRSITGLVYRSIHGVTGLVGAALDRTLGLAARQSDTRESTPERQRALAVLNGVLGDHLAADGNPLAIEMTLIGDDAQARPPAPSGDRLAVFVHGLCMDEQCWQPSDAANESTGIPEALAAKGWSVACLRYNSGRHVHENGREFDRLLSQWAANRRSRAREIALIGHSMGGLIARSAAHQGLHNASRWVDAPLRLVSLGTPHHGSPLERAGHGVDRLLGISRYSTPFTKLGKMRSAGITDLRHGNLLREDAGHPDRFHPTGDTRTPPQLPESAECFAIAATLDRHAGSTRSRHFGDGLVPVPSALGLHRDPRLKLPIEPDRRAVITETGHVELLHHPEVVREVSRWLG